MGDYEGQPLDTPVDIPPHSTPKEVRPQSRGIYVPTKYFGVQSSSQCPGGGAKEQPAVGMSAMLLNIRAWRTPVQIPPVLRLTYE